MRATRAAVKSKLDELEAELSRIERLSVDELTSEIRDTYRLAVDPAAGTTALAIFLVRGKIEKIMPWEWRNVEKTGG